MRQHWVKLGQLYQPGQHGRHKLLLTHAANPLPVHLEGDVYRIFYSGRDTQNRSSVGAVDMDVVTRRIIQDHAQPFFAHGDAGGFFADGVSIGNVYRAANGAQYMLFMGWQNPEGQHWRGDIGQLEILDDGSLRLARAQPLMAADAHDPLSLSYPYVWCDDAQHYHMLYGSTLTWDAGNGEMLHVLKYAHSGDGQEWVRTDMTVPYAPGVAQAFSRPSVLQDAQGYHLWFSYRNGLGETYRIGYAQSGDGVTWHLVLDQAGIDVSADGWDAEMICYPAVFEHGGQRYLLYNGNGYGRTGFGIAVWQ